MDVVAWLRGLGLEQHAPAFGDNDVDGDVLRELTSDDLISIGVTSVGHRRKLLAAIASLRAVPPAATVTGAPRDAPAPAEAERRQLTVMFCDLVGSTELSARLDPEDLREVIAAYHRAVAEVVAGFDGFVAKYMGDGVLVYFGYPRAHEDDAERAVQAALAVVEAVRHLQSSEALHLRIGLATGLAVVGDLIGSGAAQEQAVIGETPNLAARLQALAGPDEIVIPESTRRLIGSLFEYQNLGEVEVRGLSAPVTAFRVLRESRVGSRFEALRTAETPLIGREEEIELLSRRWAQAKTGVGRVVLISAEPGIGKSRLVETFRQNLEGEAHTRLRYFCSPHHQDSALFPFIAQLVRAAGFEYEDRVPDRLEKLDALIAASAPADGDIQLFAELLSVPFNGRYPALDLTPQRKKERTFDALLRQLSGLVHQEPVLMIFEDLHWADPTSRELLDLVVEQVDRLPVLLIATFRPEFDASWTGQPHVTALALRRLGREESSQLVRGLNGNAAALSGEMVDEIVSRTDGVPLFLEELTKAVLEARASGENNGNSAATVVPPATLAVPATLHASLMARLDRLGPTPKEIAQVGAAIGRDFPYGLLVAAARRAEEEVRDGLGGLVNAGLVFQRRAFPEATFSFKHALVRDAAHGTLLRGARQRLHARIAEQLETQSPELTESQPELFAQHYAEAGLVEKSVDYWGRAGRRSATRSAMAEAAAQLQKGLDQLALLPDDPEHQRRELEFRSTLGAVLMAAKGLAAPETGRAYARARELWEQLGSPEEFLGVPYGQSTYHTLRGEFDRARYLAEDVLRPSRHTNKPGLVLGHASLGRTLMFTGNFVPSRSHLEQVLALYDPISHHALVHQVGFHAHVNSQAYLAIVLFCLGFPDQASAMSSAAVAEALSLGHAPSLAGSLSLAAVLSSFYGDGAVLSKWARQLVALATEQGFPHLGAQGAIYSGWAKVKHGDVPEGLSLLRTGSSAFGATGAKTLMPYHIALLARACQIAGQEEEGLTLLDNALQIVESTGERWFAAELNVHKGELLLRQGQSEAAEELYRKALGVAVEQEAKMWELRAAMSLARLRRDQGRDAEACDLLAPVYGWFTEGFGTPDLKEAKALLDALA